LLFRSSTTIYRACDITVTPYVVGVSSTGVDKFAEFCTACG
jgi:hypothetical protein